VAGKKVVLNLVFLPATEPDDETFGKIPTRIEGCSSTSIHQVRYPGMVWYNAAIRQEAIDQIRALDVASIVLVGFSKSGLGAWNIARTIPDCISGTIIFDAPVARDERPVPETAPFYASDASWREDLPNRTVPAFKTAMPATHSLVLISGDGYHDEMRTLSRSIGKIRVEHTFLPRPHLKHHWNSGWIEQGLNEIYAQGGPQNGHRHRRP
tara:strand:- start:2850 stop:3479 length:630 start_codon:yes stop_codon:yes gene_type:complete